MPPRYYLDTEFADNGLNDLRLISLALVCDDGRELYLCNSAWLGDDGQPDASNADGWLREHVFPQLPYCKCPENSACRRGALYFVHKSDCRWRRTPDMREMIIDFVKDPGNGERVEFWAYFASYDWILLCWIFGRMLDLPKHFEWLVHDLRVWATTLGYTGKFKELVPDSGHHDALADARWNRDVHKILTKRFAQERDQRATALVDCLDRLLLDLNCYTVDSSAREMILRDWPEIIAKSPYR